MAKSHSPRPTGNSTEARIYDLLADSLNDDWQVWHEPEIHRAEDEDKPYRPDFVLLHRNHGLFVLEVKGWMLEQIKDVRTNKKILHTELLYEFRDGKQWIEAPFDQLTKYKRKIRQKLDHHKLSLGLSSKKINKLFDGAVAFANISREELDRPIRESFTSRLSIKRAKVLSVTGQRGFYKSEIDTWKASPEQVECGLTKSSGELVLSEPDLDVIRGIVHPESCLPVAPGDLITVEQLRAAKGTPLGILKKAIERPPDELRVLSQKQESVARYEIGGGHRILFGVAGSGKTMILIARARWLAMRNPAQGILVLCFNRALSLYIAKVLENYENIDVMTFHAWVREKLGFDLEFNDAEYDSKLLEYLWERDVEKYQSILIDECQDWHPDWFKAVLRVADDPVNGDLLIVGDGSQSIYRKHGSFSWEDCGINPQHWRGNDRPGPITFDRNYRNTPQIVALASSFAQSGMVRGDDSGKGILSLIPDPDECVRGDGPLPNLGQFSDRAQEMEFVAAQIRNLIETIECLEPCDFAVVYPGHFGVVRAVEQFSALFEKLDLMSISHDLVQGGAERNQERLLEGNTVKILNIKQMKGLEQKVCFVIGVDEYWETKEEDLLYVAITRATDRLYLTWSGKERTSIVERLTADSSLYDWCGIPQGKAKMNEILDCLNSVRIRCTYNALAEYLKVGMTDVFVMLGQRRPEASWVVNRNSLRPTGYSPNQTHPDLYKNKVVITTGAELERLIENSHGTKG